MKSINLGCSVFIIIGFIITNLKAQELGEWNITDSRYKLSAYNLCENVDNDNIIRVNNIEWFKGYTKTNIIDKIDKSGKVIQTIEYSFDTIENSFHKLFWFPAENKAVLIGTTDRRLSYLEIDSDLNIKYDTVFDVGINSHFDHLDGIVVEDSLFFLAGYTKIAEQVAPIDAQNSFIRINRINKSIEYQTIVDSIGGDIDLKCWALVEDINSDSILCIGNYPYHISKDFKKIYVQNRSTKIGIGGGNQVRAIQWDKDQYLIGSSVGTNSPPGFSSGALVQKVDKNLKRKSFGGINAFAFGLPQKAVDFYDRNKIYTAVQEPPFAGPGHNGFLIMQLDSSLKSNWTLTVNGDTVFTVLRGMTATTDGGIIVWGARWVLDAQELFPYMIKFNCNGDLVFTDNIDLSNFTIIKTYPNPSSGPLNIDIQGITGHADVRIYDMQGRNVYVQDGLESGTTPMDLSGLAAGTYIYKIYDGSKMIGTGEWVKM